MSKRMTKEQRKQQQEIAAIEHELRLIAQGAAGWAAVEDEDEDGASMVNTIGLEAFVNYLSAIKRIWNIGYKREDWPNGFKNWMVEFYNLAKWGSIKSSAEFLHGHGARAGGEWVE